jgi:hypothetical protein
MKSKKVILVILTFLFISGLSASVKAQDQAYKVSWQQNPSR